MTINIPEKWRGVIYIVATVAGLLSSYLAATGVIGSHEVAFVTGLISFATLLARVNLSPSPSDGGPPPRG